MPECQATHNFSTSPTLQVRFWHTKCHANPFFGGPTGRQPTRSWYVLSELRHKRQVRSGTSDRLAVPGITNLLVPMTFRSSQKSAAETDCELPKVGTSVAIMKAG